MQRQRGAAQHLAGAKSSTRAKSHFYIRSSEWRRSEIRFFGGDRQNFGIVISGLPVQFFRQGPTISNDSISDKDSVTA